MPRPTFAKALAQLMKRYPKTLNIAKSSTTHFARNYSRTSRSSEIRNFGTIFIQNTAQPKLQLPFPKRDYPTISLTKKDSDRIFNFMMLQVSQYQESFSKKEIDKVKFVALLISRGVFEFENDEITFLNFDEMKQIVKNELNMEDEEFSKNLQRVIGEMKPQINVFDMRNPDDGKPFAPKVFKARNQKENKNPDNKKIKAFAEQRHFLDSWIASPDKINREFNLDEVLLAWKRSFAAQLIKNKSLEDILQKMGFAPKEAFSRLRPDLDLTDIGASYMRDSYLVIGDKIFAPSDETFGYLAKTSPYRRHFHHVIKNSFAGVADLRLSGHEIKELPFMLEDGNVVFSEEKNTMFFCINNFNLLPQKDLIEWFEDGKVSYLETKDFLKKLENWGQENGFKTQIVERNLETLKNIDKFYHLDIFFNIVGNIVIFYKDAVSPESYQKIQEIFGPENIIELSQEEQNAIASNFIPVDDTNVIFTSAKSIDALSGLIEKLNEKGINCGFASHYLGQNQDDGVRCKTSQIAKNPRVTFNNDHFAKVRASDNLEKI